MSNFSEAVQSKKNEVTVAGSDALNTNVDQANDIAKKESGRVSDAKQESFAASSAAGENATANTGSASEALGSADRHGVSESAPIASSSVSEYSGEKRGAAPPIVGGDLYSILRQSGEQRSAEYTPAVATVEQGDVRETWATEKAALGTGAGAAVGATTGSVPSYLSHSTYTSSSMPWNSTQGDAVASQDLAASSAAGAGASQAGLERFEPTDEQAWSVRGPASNVMSRGPHDLAHQETSGAFGAAGTAGAAGAAGSASGLGSANAGVPGAGASSDLSSSVPGKGQDVFGGADNKLGDATKGSDGKVGDFAKDAEGKVGDATKGTEGKAGDAVKDAKDKPANVAQQAEQKAGGAKKQGTDAVDTAKGAGKAKKGGFMSKVKKALHIGKESK